MIRLSACNGEPQSAVVEALKDTPEGAKTTVAGRLCIDEVGIPVGLAMRIA